jgi:hypothetical protein
MSLRKSQSVSHRVDSTIRRAIACSWQASHPPSYLEARSIRLKEYGKNRFSGARLIPQKVIKMTLSREGLGRITNLVRLGPGPTQLSKIGFMIQDDKISMATAPDRKVVQISTMVHPEKDWAFVALCDDGSIWLYHGSWSQIEAIPQTTYR